jgi:hypothetical protein
MSKQLTLPFTNGIAPASSNDFIIGLSNFDFSLKIANPCVDIVPFKKKISLTDIGIPCKKDN